MTRFLSVGAGLAAVGVWGAAAWGQGCEPHWSTTFVSGIDGGVQALAVVSDGERLSLYVGGRFGHAGGIPARQIARYSAGVWSPLGDGIPGQFNSHGFQGCCAAVLSIAPGLPGSGALVHVAGDFIVAGAEIVESIADWDGTAWSDLAGGVAHSGCVDCPYRVHGTAIADLGGGPALYAAGGFDLAGGVAAARAARWNGQAWSPLGAGLGAAAGDPFPTWANAIAAFAGPAGPALYAAGRFSRAGTINTNCIARWDGQAWSAVGSGVQQPPGGPTPSANALAVFDDGRGPALYMAGYFQIVGGVPARHIARWDGSSWSPLAEGIGSGVNDQVYALAAFNDGRGPALYAGGNFQDAGGQPAAGIARWDGQRWSALGSGLGTGVAHALEVYDDGTGPALYVGGWFTTAGGLPAAALARWGGCSCYANCDASTGTPALNVADFVCFLSRFAAGDPYANCDGSTTPPVLNVLDFVCFQGRFAAGCP